jgi:hypothetical protein
MNGPLACRGAPSIIPGGASASLLTRHLSKQSFSRAILIFALILLSIGAVLLAVSFQLPYSFVRDQLVHLYGEERVARHFSAALFSAAMFRLGLFAGFMPITAIVLVRTRHSLAASADLFWRALSMGLAHSRRSLSRCSIRGILPLGAIVLVGFAVRLRFLNQPMRNDESSTLLGYASQPLYVAISLYNAPNNHLFHTLLVHFSTALWGNSEWAIRLPAFIAGVLLIPLTYLLAASFASATAGLLAAGIVSASSIMIEYSTNARGYTLICCATVALIVAGAGMLRKAAPAWFALFAVVAVLGLWAIPVFLVAFGGILLWLAAESYSRPRRFRRIFLIRLLIACVLAGAGTIFVYFPPLAVSGLHSLVNNEWIAPKNFQLFLQGNRDQFGNTWLLWNRDLPVWWGSIMASGFFLGTLFYPRLRRLILWMAFWTIVLFSARRFVPFTRTWLLFFPVFVAVSASAVSRIFEFLIPAGRRLAVGAIAAVALVGLLSVQVLRTQSVLASAETGVLKDASRIVDFLISRHISPETVFRNTDYDLPLQYYWWRRSGARPAKPSLANVGESADSEAWILLNGALSESFEQRAQQLGYTGTRIIEERAFDGATLIRFTRSRSRIP